jgi:hypothetical protein
MTQRHGAGCADLSSGGHDMYLSLRAGWAVTM